MKSEEADRISFVLPVSIANTGRDGDDLRRLKPLLASFLGRFFLPDLQDFWVVTPPGEIDQVRSALRAHTADQRFRVIPETAVCPELASDPDTTDSWPRSNKGWHRQQLIKLATCDVVETPFYVTLDADVTCSRRFRASDLVSGGQALCGVETEADYRALYTPDFASWEVQVKEQRVGFAERVFNAPRPHEHRGEYYAETPVVFATDAVRAMAARLESQYRLPWRQVLLANLPWTEQALFFHFLEVEGQLEKYYRKGGPNAVLRLYDSLWQAPSWYVVERTLATWNIERAFSQTADGYFVVVQSHLGLPIDEVERRIMPFLF